MKLNEKVSYLKGLLDGMEINDSTKEGKALIQMAKVMQEMVLCVDDLQSQVDELTELCDILDSDLGDVEEIVYDGLDECDCDDDCCSHDDELDDDDDLYEVSCPSCGDVVLIDESMLEEGFMDCPNCGETLEFDFDEVDLSGQEEDSKE